MQVDNRLLDDLARLTSGALGSLAGLKEEIDEKAVVYLHGGAPPTAFALAERSMGRPHPSRNRGKLARLKERPYKGRGHGAVRKGDPGRCRTA